MALKDVECLWQLIGVCVDLKSFVFVQFVLPLIFFQQVACAWSSRMPNYLLFCQVVERFLLGLGRE